MNEQESKLVPALEKFLVWKARQAHSTHKSPSVLSMEVRNVREWRKPRRESSQTGKDPGRLPGGGFTDLPVMNEMHSRGQVQVKKPSWGRGFVSRKESTQEPLPVSSFYIKYILVHPF